MKIYCSLCAYHPHASDRWICDPGCSHVWNTFETRARCPGCSKQWRVTACPSCNVLSPHEDWYHDETPDAAIQEREQVEELVGAGVD